MPNTEHYRNVLRRAVETRPDILAIGGTAVTLMTGEAFVLSLELCDLLARQGNNKAETASLFC